ATEVDLGTLLPVATGTGGIVKNIASLGIAQRTARKAIDQQVGVDLAGAQERDQVHYGGSVKVRAKVVGGVGGAVEPFQRVLLAGAHHAQDACEASVVTGVQAVGAIGALVVPAVAFGAEPGDS